MGSTSGMLQDTIGKLNLMLQTGAKTNVHPAHFASCCEGAPDDKEKMCDCTHLLCLHCCFVLGGSKHMCYLIVFVVFAFIAIAWIMKHKGQ